VGPRRHADCAGTTGDGEGVVELEVAVRVIAGQDRAGALHVQLVSARGDQRTVDVVIRKGFCIGQPTVKKNVTSMQ